MTSCERQFEGFADLKKCQEVIGDIINGEEGFEKPIEEFKKLIQIYSQQPQLLDPHIGSLILKLTGSLSRQNLSAARYHAIFKILYELTVVGGFKNVSRNFPHDTDKLPFVVDLLAKENPEDKSHWETRYVLTVWLSIATIVPFNLTKFDSGTGDPLSHRIYTLLKQNLLLHDSCQQVTAYCLSKFFSRTDIVEQSSNDYISKFFAEALEEIKNTKVGSANSMDDIKLIGYLRTLAYMYEFLPRSAIKPRSPALLKVITDLDLINVNRILVTHMFVKVVQRAGLSLLPVRLAGWRYKRATRLLGSLKDFSDGTLPSTLTKQTIINDVQMDTNPEQLIEEQESLQYIEMILGALFTAAQNAQTRIRWSAAKGIAQAASRLSKERAGDIIDMVTDGDFFSPLSNESAWHGGCLILAEMSRHGIILEEKLERVMGIVRNAIVFDKIKGSMATGAHIREAACYICWAMSRTYEDAILKPYISALSANLLCDMLFDKELQCRRAASAAFQELIGRQGAFSQEEISLLTDLDYHNVGQRQFAYLHLAPMVAKRGDKYVEPFVDHLIELKVAHWDLEIRRLASQALAALMLYYPQDKITDFILPRLYSMCHQQEDFNMKHGGILSLANVIGSLASLNYKFDEKLIDFVANLAQSCDKQLKTKLHAPKFIEAICQLIKNSEKPQFQFNTEGRKSCLESWESIVMTSLDSDSQDIRLIGSEAFLSIYRTYYQMDKTSQDRLLTQLNKTLLSLNESSRCGALMALSRLSQVPSVLFSSNDGDQTATESSESVKKSMIRRDADLVDIVLMSLAGYISKDTHEKAQDICMPKAKAQACESLVEFIRHLDDTSLLTSKNFIQAGYDALLGKTEDYTFDKRGDIGVIVRQASIKALTEITGLLLARFNLPTSSTEERLFTEERIGKLMSKIVQQAIAYHDSCRELAGKCFYQLVTSQDLPENLIPQKASILKLFKRFEVDETFEWRHQSTPIFVNMLPKIEYSSDLWRGLISGVGQLSVMGARQFKIALADYLRTLDTDHEHQHHGVVLNNGEENLVENRKQVYHSLMDTLEAISPNDRALMAALSLIDFLLTEGLLDEEMCARRLDQYCWLLYTKSPTNDIKRLMAITRILTSLLQFTDGTQVDALRHCLTMLISQFAKVRTFVAEQLYEALLTYQSDLELSLNKLKLGSNETESQVSSTLSELESRDSSSLGDSQDDGPTTEKAPNLNGAMELLSETKWDQPLSLVKPIQTQVCSLLNMDQ